MPFRQNWHPFSPKDARFPDAPMAFGAMVMACAGPNSGPPIRRRRQGRRLQRIGPGLALSRGATCRLNHPRMPAALNMTAVPGVIKLAANALRSRCFLRRWRDGA